MALRKLFRRKQIHDLIEHPESLDVKELIGIAHSVFAVQSVVGSAAFVHSALRESIALVAIGNVAFPVLGWLCTRNDSPENFRAIRWCAGYWFLGILHTLYLALTGLSIKALLVGALKLVLFGAQWLVLARLWRLLQDQALKQVPFFLNIVVKNKAEAVKAQVQERHPRAGALLGKLANKLVTEDKFATKIASKIVESIPAKLDREVGLTVSATKEFQKGNFVVIRVGIERVDVHKMALLKGGKDKARQADLLLTLVSCLPTRIGRDLEYVLCCGLASGLLRNMPTQMALQMQELAGVEVEVEARPPEEEADFLFAALRELEGAS